MFPQRAKPKANEHETQHKATEASLTFSVRVSLYGILTLSAIPCNTALDPVAVWLHGLPARWPCHRHGPTCPM